MTAERADVGYRLPAIPYLRLRATFRAAFENGTEARLPGFKGSMLRGAFGHALRQAVCAMGPRQECESCSLRGPCVYTRLFETVINGDPPPFLRGLSTAPRPYVFEPRTEARDFRAGDALETDLLLFGRAAELQPYALLALERMGEGGLGRGRYSFTLERVDYLEEGGTWRTGFAAGASDAAGEAVRWPTKVPAILPSGEDPDDSTERLTLRFLTPTRVRLGGRLRDHLPFRPLVFLMLRRALEIAHFHVPGTEPDWDFRPFLDRADDVRVTRSDLRWQDWSRYSNRQGRKHEMGGFVGEIGLEGPLAPFLPLLRTAEVLHVGKGATFGLGKVEVMPPQPG
ncbi:MAG TPA: CRISPR system precrRNA processing endoribonuclease RAMP protein Cas6 [Thermoanaerobaculia bacterium]|nr:CRISPR system precrRNA processing endoribonuclease RAMP protein Cas6 [Thermoanaerobaculia bacterium]